MTITVSRLFDDYETARRAVNDLEAAGVSRDEISIIASNADNWYRDDGGGGRRVDRDADGVDDRAEGAGAGAGIGAAIGGVAGALAGLGLIAIPGLGPVVAAGWLAAAATGAVAGGAAGGIVGALTQAGVSDEDANVYAEGIRRGGALVAVRVPETARAKADAILDRSAVNLRARSETYRRSGWTRFDEASVPFDADQVRRERELYRTRGAA